MLRIDLCEFDLQFEFVCSFETCLSRNNDLMIKFVQDMPKQPTYAAT